MPYFITIIKYQKHPEDINNLKRWEDAHPEKLYSVLIQQEEFMTVKSINEWNITDVASHHLFNSLSSHLTLFSLTEAHLLAVPSHKLIRSS